MIRGGFRLCYAPGKFGRRGCGGGGGGGRCGGGWRLTPVFLVVLGSSSEGYSASPRSTGRRPRCFDPRRYPPGRQGPKRDGDGEAGRGATGRDREATPLTSLPWRYLHPARGRVVFTVDLDTHSAHPESSSSAQHTLHPLLALPPRAAPRHKGQYILDMRAPRVRARTADAAWRAGGLCFRGLWRAGSGRGLGGRSDGRFGMTSGAVEFTGDGGRAKRRLGET